MSTNTQMKAAWYEELGSAEKVLKVGKMPIPKIGPAEVLIRLYTSGINAADVKKRQGIREEMQYTRIIPHNDGAGIIEDVGSQVSQERIGERVWVYNARWNRPLGTASDYLVISSEQAVPLPDNTSFEVGACLGIPAMTAHRCVFSSGSVDGKTILVTGGAGSVGYYAIQFAKWGGATVIATVSSEEKAEYAKKAGADYVLNYKIENISDKVKTITNNQGVNLIVDVDFGGNLSVTQDIVALNGCIATYASERIAKPAIDFYALMFKGVTLHLVNVFELPDESRTQALEDINLALRSDKLSHAISKIFALNEIITAHHFVENAKAVGNVVLKIR